MTMEMTMRSLYVGTHHVVYRYVLWTILYMLCVVRYREYSNIRTIVYCIYSRTTHCIYVALSYGAQ